MKVFFRTVVVLALAAPALRAADDFIDGVEDRLAVSAFDDNIRAQLSGTLDLEGYDVGQPIPGLIGTGDGTDFFVPRLSLFLDAQLGQYVYAFAQTRVDRGFDPGSNGSLRPRLDEYLVRFTPSKQGRFDVQLGKFATVVGNWTPIHDSWADPFVTAPLPYDNLTGIWDAVALRSTSELLQWAHVVPYPPVVADPYKQLRLPILWGPSYAAGAAVSGDLGLIQYALEVKNASLSSRPDTWSPAQTRWHHPTFSGRIGARPDELWNFGVSASEGAYLRDSAAPTVPQGRSLADYREIVAGADAAFAWHHFQAWAEVYAARFEVPAVTNADTAAYYVAAKYKLAPQLSWAVRWNQQLYATVPVDGVRTPWGHDLWRIDQGPTYRFTPHIQLKLQTSIEQGDPGATGAVGTAAAQLTVRF